MNLISEDYLMHHGVKGMKWGVRKRQEVYRRAAEQAKQYSGYASESHSNFSKMKANKKKDIGKNEISRWKRVSSRQKSQYDRLYKKYSSTPVNQITRKDYKAAKKFLKTNFEDADYTDVFFNGKTTNYQLRNDYDFETGSFKKKK